MIVSNIEVPNIDEIEKRLGQFKAKAPQALYRAINNAVDKAFTEDKKAASEKYNVAQKNVAPTLRKAKASKANLKGAVISTGERIPLYDFKHKDGDPISVAVKKGNSMKPLSGDPKAFIATMKNGHIGIFERKGTLQKGRKTRRPGVQRTVNKHNERIKQLHSLSVPQMLKDEKMMKQVEKAAMNRLHERLEHHIDRILQKG